MAQLGRYHGTSQFAHIEELAEAEAVPANYLVQILNELRNGGLVSSKRGKQGGYTLARSPDEISLKDIVNVVDADFLEAHPKPDGQSGPLVAKAWNTVTWELASRLQGITLEQLMPAKSDMYYI